MVVGDENQNDNITAFTSRKRVVPDELTQITFKFNDSRFSLLTLKYTVTILLITLPLMQILCLGNDKQEETARMESFVWECTSNYEGQR